VAIYFYLTSLRGGFFGNINGDHRREFIRKSPTGTRLVPSVPDSSARDGYGPMITRRSMTGRIRYCLGEGHPVDGIIIIIINNIHICRKIEKI